MLAWRCESEKYVVVLVALERRVDQVNGFVLDIPSENIEIVAVIKNVLHPTSIHQSMLARQIRRVAKVPHAVRNSRFPSLALLSGFCESGKIIIHEVKRN